MIRFRIGSYLRAGVKKVAAVVVDVEPEEVGREESPQNLATHR